MTPEPVGSAAARPPGLQWWPSIAAFAFAAFVAIDLFRGQQEGHELAAIVAASGLVYLVAAALERPSVAWPAFFGTVAVITAAKQGWIRFDATWILLAVAVLTVLVGIWRGARYPAGGLPLQSVAMLVCGAIAAVALAVNPVAGALLVAAGLLGHAAWDVYHHRVGKVVGRSMAEFCCVLDVALAVAIVVATFW